MKLIAPTPLALRESRWQRRFLWALHALATLVALSLPQPWMLLALGWVALMYCLSFWPAPRPRELFWLEDGRLGWRMQDGESGEGRLLASSLVTPHCWLLQVQTVRRQITKPVWFDAADPQDLRRWRVYLRWRLAELSEEQGKEKR